MYVPEPFRRDDPETLHPFIRAHPFATLVTGAAGMPQATHLPLILEGGVLRGHMARGNPHWKTIAAGQPALAIFLGPHAYVSPQWYPGKKVDGKTVPTWNYAVVHAAGPIRVTEDADWLRAHVSALTDQQEAPLAEPWKVTDAPEDYVRKMLTAIVGVELEVTSLTGKWKLSQNRAPADHDGARDGLAARGGASAEVAALMRRPPAQAGT